MPPTKPTALKVLQGERRRERLNMESPKPEGQISTTPPDRLHGPGRRVWRRVVKAMAATGVLTTVDADALVMYCEAMGRYEQSSKLLHEQGPLVEGRAGEPVRNPLHTITRDNALVAIRLANMLGFTPAGRENIRAPQKGESDPLGAWQRGAQAR